MSPIEKIFKKRNAGSFCCEPHFEEFKAELYKLVADTDDELTDEIWFAFALGYQAGENNSVMEQVKRKGE